MSAVPYRENSEVEKQPDPPRFCRDCKFVGERREKLWETECMHHVATVPTAYEPVQQFIGIFNESNNCPLYRAKED